MSKLKTVGSGLDPDPGRFFPIRTLSGQKIRNPNNEVIYGIIFREEMEKDVGSTSPVYVAAAATWATWAVGAVTAKFYKVFVPSTELIQKKSRIRD